MDLTHLSQRAPNPDAIVAGMLKEIIICDYHKQDYKLPEPKKPWIILIS